MAQPRPVPPADPSERLLGASPAVAALRTQLRHLAAFDTPGGVAVPTVLLQGETGTGKGLIARLLHDSGPRARGRFVEVNCTAIPEHLVETELFGVVAGAYTDAKQTKPGLFEEASGGTLFLDEIDAMPLALQGKLLTAIEAKRVRRVGAVTERPVDIKLIAATQADLGARVHQGRFRADLYFRLAAIPLVVPPLRARGEDVVLLAQHYLQWYAEAHGVRARRLTPAAEARLRAYGWPGNVRELMHLMERVILLHPDAPVERQALARLGLPEGPPATEAVAPPPESDTAMDEPAQIRQALAQTQGNVAQAARRLGWSRKTLRYRMQRHAIDLTPRARGRPLRSTHRDGKPALTPAGEPPAAAPSAEQKPVAVLAIELTFPEAAGSIPAYEPWTAARRWALAVEEKVEGFGGTLIQQGPALLLVVFGVPHTLEQLPQRAVQAALAMRQLTAERRVPGPGLRQALHWGSVLVNAAAPTPAQGLLPRGDTLGLPVRLLGQAGPGEIVLSPTLARLVVGWCALEALPPPAGEGDPVQISAYRVLGLVPPRSPLAGIRAQALSPFVGRERELAVLQVLLAEVEAGRGQAVGVVGEPGVGKSRLLLEFRQRLAGRGVTYLEGRGLSYEGTVPYRAVLELLCENCGITGTDAPERAADNVHRALEEVGMLPDEWAPYLLHLLGLPGALERVAGLSPEALRQRTHEALWQLSLRGSQRRPLILAVEDLQWVDPSSEAVFATLVERLANAPILFFATYRSGYRPGWLERSCATQLVLRPLSPPDSQRVVQAVWRAVPSPAPVTEAILARAEGNPLFLEELTRAVLEQGEAPASAAVPDTLQGVLLARIDRLPADAKRVLQCAAVMGRDCPLSLLEALWEREPTALPPALARLVEAELLYAQGVPSEAGYRFKHALIQEAAYQTLPPGPRQQAHDQVARVLAERFPEMVATRPELLAHHYTMAGFSEQAIAYWQQAGQRAIERSANVEAISHLAKGLELLKTLPATSERAQHELTLQLALGSPLLMMKGYTAPEVEHAYSRAWQLCQQVGGSPHLFSALVGLWRFYLNRGELLTARDLGERCFALAQSGQDPALLQEVHLMLGSTAMLMGELVSARTHLERGIALHDPQQGRSRAFSRGSDPGTDCLAREAWTLWLLGYPDQALTRSNEALALAQESSHAGSLALALHYTAMIHRWRWELNDAQVRAEAVIRLSSEHQFVQWLGLGKIVRGWILAEQRAIENGIEEIRAGLETARAIGTEVGLSYKLAYLAEAYGKGGQIGTGLRILDKALAVVHKNAERFYEAELYRLKGELLWRKDNRQRTTGEGNIEEAEESFLRAIEIARHQQARSLELRAVVGLSSLWQQLGKQVEARQTLAESYGWFTEGYDTHDLREARTMLDALG